MKQNITARYVSKQDPITNLPSHKIESNKEDAYVFWHAGAEYSCEFNKTCIYDQTPKEIAPIGNDTDIGIVLV